MHARCSQVHRFQGRAADCRPVAGLQVQCVGGKAKKCSVGGARKEGAVRGGQGEKVQCVGGKEKRCSDL